MRRQSRSKPPTEGSIRIIGGDWRGRKLHFPITDGLRPTGDRVRETLFNWLAPYIAGARCLDAFAGSGALGLEALSRGAAQCQFLDPQREVTTALQSNLSLLKAQAGTVTQASALEWLSRSVEPFDIVFIDPPFDSDLYEPTLKLLLERSLLADGGWLYLESARDRQLPMPEGLRLHRDKVAGQTRYQLWQHLN